LARRPCHIPVALNASLKSQSVLSSKLSIQTLEVFEITARTGSLQETSRLSSLSIAAVSHHIGRLEAELNTPLFDRSRRPMPLTAAGQTFLTRIEGALRQIRRATREAALADLTRVRDLRIAMVEDFDSHVAPELVVSLTQTMPQMSLTLRCEPSHRAIDRLRRREVDVAVAMEPPERCKDLDSAPLVRDPLVLAVPRSAGHTAEHYFTDASRVPFLRFSSEHLIGRLIEAHLRRNRINLARRYELESAQSIFAMIANGTGWTITTPLSYQRAQRFHDQVDLCPLPLPAHARWLSVLRHVDEDVVVSDSISALLRQLVLTSCVLPIVERYPWLADGFHIADQPPTTRKYLTEISGISDGESIPDRARDGGG
ncbi:MAG: LysR family transcriptional regulator, partial [Pseudomonadota bacterium]